MSTFTRAQLIARINQVTAINKYRISRDTDAEGLAMDNELFAIALASLEAEPVAWRHFQETPTDGGYWILNDYKPNCSGVEPLYAAPPAPVSVPDELLSAMEEVLRISDRDHDAWHKAKAGILSCRAAMLQGADDEIGSWQNDKNTPSLREAVSALRNSGVDIDTGKIQAERDSVNSPVVQDGWVACSERMPDNDDFVYIWPRPDFGVELHVAQYGKFDRRDTAWYAQLYEQNFGIEYQPITVTHWMPLPTAPQQEVK